MRVLDHFNLGHRNQSLIDHLVQERQEFLNLVIGIDNTDHNGSIVGEGKGVRPADQRTGAVSLDSSKNRGTGDVQLASLLDNRAVEWFIFPFIVFSEINAQHLGLPL